MYDQLEKALRSRRRVALTTHVAPDPDGLGSALALRYGLSRLGIESEIVVNGPVSRRFAFMDPDRAIREFPSQIDRDAVAGFDGVVVLDCGEWKRIGAVGEAFAPDVVKMCIDHHVANSGFASVTCWRVEATATAEMIHDFLCGHLRLPFDARMALPIYAALVTETGGFAYSNTTAKAHRLAGECLDLGVQAALVNTALNESRRLASLRLAARALDRLEVDGSGKLAWIALTLEDFRSTGATAEDITGLVDYPRSVEGVEVAILMFEDEPRSVKVSFRSKSVVDVNQLAGRFGGGGHVRAAGALLRTGIASAKEQLVAAAREVVAPPGQ
jgi:phosphoesterase RecJ-like protein